MFVPESIENKLREWSKITGTPYANLSLGPTAVEYIEAATDDGLDVKLQDLIGWKIRRVDRDDWVDWMPYRIREYANGVVRIHYLNTCHDSPCRTYCISLAVIGGGIVTIDEWNKDQLISSKYAAVCPEGESRPSDSEINEIAAAMHSSLQ